MRRVRRSELKKAPYNPRQIDDNAKKKLRAGLKRFGLVQPIIWNTRTGNIVGGHQRIDAMDSLEKGKDYELDVAVINVDEKAEKELNLLLNNELVSGSFDMPKLDKLMKEINFENAGFDKHDLAIILPSFEIPISELAKQQTAEVAAVVNDVEAEKKKGRALRKQIVSQMLARDADRRPELVDMELYIVVVFPNRDRSDQFLQMLKLPTTEKYINGETVIAAIQQGKAPKAKKAVA